MKDNFYKTIVLAGLAAFLGSMSVLVPVAAQAQNATNSPLPVLPVRHQLFHGKVTAVDTNVMTLTVNLVLPANVPNAVNPTGPVTPLTLSITSQTKITKNGQPATLSEIMVDDPVVGSYKTAADGKLNALVIRAGIRHKKPQPAPNAGAGVSPVPSTPN